MVGLLETARLRLRQLATSDAPFMLRLLNEPSFIRNIGDRGVRTVADAERYLADRVLASYARHGYGLYMVEIRHDGVPAGICGLVRRDFLADPDVGFAFLPEYWSRGYALESARAVLDFARRELSIPRIVAIVSPDNAASIRVLHRLGLAFERMLEGPGVDQPTALYSAPATQVNVSNQGRCT